MFTERKPGNLKGWSEVWEARQAELKSSARKVGRLVNLDPQSFEGVTFSTREEDLFDHTITLKTLSLEPTQKELAAAPMSIKRLLVDLGIRPQDGITVELAKGYFERFDFIIKPKEISEDRVGVTLSTSPMRAGRIGLQSSPNWKWDNDKVILDTFSHPIGFNYTPRFKGEAAEKVRETYGYVYSNIHPNDQKSWHPHVIEMLTSSVDWTASMVASRRKPLNK